MSVREMRQLLGLGKTDSYWLLHKNLFEVILINDKRRIVISSFEKWYANQVKYHKVNGSPPGEELCKRSYSVPDAAEILKVKPETIYTLIRQGKLKTETTDFCMRIPKEEFERWYQRLLKYEAVDPMCGKRQHQYVSPGTVRSVHKILRSAFEQAVKWELMEKNPCIYATLPKYTAKKRDIWTAETLFHALEVCDDPRLRLCINLSFSCSLRLGELLGLTWDCVDISPESIEAGRASIYINKELQRVDIASLNALENKNVITRFPSLSSRCTTVQVLKSPKTDSSIRTIFLPKTVAEMLVHYKAEQDMTKDALGAE